jgi:hypothetical protein
MQATSKQLRLIGALFTTQGVTDRADRLERVALVTGRQVASSKDLTAAEASRVIDALKGDGDDPDE